MPCSPFEGPAYHSISKGREVAGCDQGHVTDWWPRGGPPLAPPGHDRQTPLSVSAALSREGESSHMNHTIPGVPGASGREAALRFPMP